MDKYSAMENKLEFLHFYKCTVIYMLILLALIFTHLNRKKSKLLRILVISFTCLNSIKLLFYTNTQSSIQLNSTERRMQKAALYQIISTTRVATNWWWVLNLGFQGWTEPLNLVLKLVPVLTLIFKVGLRAGGAQFWKPGFYWKASVI